MTNNKDTTHAKRVLFMPASKDFRDEEYFQPKKILEDSGVLTTTASTILGELTGMLGSTARSTINIADTKVEDYDAVVFVGGIGAEKLFHDHFAIEIAKNSLKNNKILAAICIAPMILANSGVLKGKKATISSYLSKELASKGAIYTNSPVEADGIIITASGPRSSDIFAKTILKLLSK